MIILKIIIMLNNKINSEILYLIESKLQNILSKI